MNKFNQKTFLKTGILEKLKKLRLKLNNVNYIFNSWYYEKKFYYFYFENDKNAKMCLVRLYGQHLNDYANTFDLILKTFENNNFKIIEQ